MTWSGTGVTDWCEYDIGRFKCDMEWCRYDMGQHRCDGMVKGVTWSGADMIWSGAGKVACV